jgi:Ice-binding-like/PEP-CTERM motif
MKTFKLAIPLLTAIACAPGLASASVLLGTELLNLSIYANTYVSTGANAIVYGNVLGGTYGTSGAGSSILGNFQSGDVGTLGANGTVQGNFQSIEAGNIGAGATVKGNFQVGGVGTTGADATVKGNFESGLAGTTGAGARIDGNFNTGTFPTLGAGSTVGGSIGATNVSDMNAMKTAMTSSLAATKVELDAEKSTLSAMGTGTGLEATMTTNQTFLAGVYSAASWSTTAGTTLTLDGQNMANQTWVFNIVDILATGANSHIELINAGTNAQVFWNTGGYASLGADSTFLGFVLAKTYISVGANAVLSNLEGASCGGLFSSTSYVSIGAGAQVGSGGCSATPSIPTAVPEPESYALMLAGLSVIVGFTRRRAKKSA